MSVFDSPIFIAAVSAIGGSVGTGVVGVFAGWWRRKTSISLEVIERQGRLQASDERLWEKLIMLRKVAENQGWKIPDREWEYPVSPGKLNDSR